MSVIEDILEQCFSQLTRLAVPWCASYRLPGECVERLGSMSSLLMV